MNESAKSNNDTTRSRVTNDGHFGWFKLTNDATYQ